MDRNLCPKELGISRIRHAAKVLRGCLARQDKLGNPMPCCGKERLGAAQVVILEGCMRHLFRSG